MDELLDIIELIKLCITFAKNKNFESVYLGNFKRNYFNLDEIKIIGNHFTTLDYKLVFKKWDDEKWNTKDGKILYSLVHVSWNKGEQCSFIDYFLGYNRIVFIDKDENKDNKNTIIH